MNTSVFPVIHLVPAARSSSSARLARAFFSRMILALAGHLKGFGLALRSVSQVSMAASSSATLLNTPRRICWRVISANSRSTRLIQDDDVWCEVQLEARMLGEPSLHLRLCFKPPDCA